MQGRLLDIAGDPLPGPVNLSIRIYDQLVGGTLLFLEDHSGTMLVDGTFSVLIGTGSVAVGSLDAETFAEAGRFLELVVNGDFLEPRQPFSSVAYALQSQEAQRAVSADSIGLLGVSDIQQVLVSSCAPGSFLQGLDPDGAINCQAPAFEPHGHNASEITYGCGTYALASFCPNTLNNSAGPNCDDVPAGAFCESDGECGLSTAANCGGQTTWYFKVSE
jgi:hypothetical protein